MYAAIILLLRFNREIVHYISSFLSVRCALCDDGRGILVRNGLDDGMFGAYHAV